MPPAKSLWGRTYRPRFESLEPRTMMAGDAILHWNDVAMDVVAADHTFANMKEQVGPTGASRALAIVHTAMFDSINSILGKYEPYLIKVAGTSGADIDAAVGQAAHDTLVALYTQQKTAIDQALTDWLAQIPNGKAENMGIALGKTVASAILSARANDGAGAASDYEYTDGAIGHHQPDPVTFEESGVLQGPLGPEWGDVKTFGIPNVKAFLPPRPPALNSAAYTAAYNELLQLGGDGENTPTSRTDEQTEIGIFWAYDGTQGLCAPPRLYNQIAQVIAVQQNNSEYANARLFCLINVAMADACIVGWECKYTDDFWRPVVGIRAGDQDGNPNTAGVADWSPLGAPASNETFPNNFTPPFPAYVSGHAIFGAALFQTLTRFYGRDKIAFSFTSDEFNGTTTDNTGQTRPEVTRNYTSFSQASLENGLSRIYLGIHWRFDITNGIAAGNKVADNIYNRLLEPLKLSLPAGSVKYLPVSYAVSVLQTKAMQLQDGVHRQVVMMQPVSTAPGANFTFTSPSLAALYAANKKTPQGGLLLVAMTAEKTRSALVMNAVANVLSIASR